MKITNGLNALLVMLFSMAIHASPTVRHVGPVAPDVIEIVLEAGRAKIGIQIPYVERDGDVVQSGEHKTYLVREGKRLGVLVGENPRMFRAFDTLEGELLESHQIDSASEFSISSPDDPRYKVPVHPKAVYRKSKPTNVARTADWKFEAPIEYHIFLVMPDRLQKEARYDIVLDSIESPKCTLHYHPVSLRSGAVHISQIGFAPGDPAKVAFLSCWMGDGGPMDYPGDLTFHVVKDNDDSIVYTGKVSLSKPKTANDEDAYKHNFNKTNVYEMEFSDLDTPGRYRVYVEGVGCSYPFRIDSEVWKEAFVTAARGFFHQRSGIALGPPYTSFKRPRSFYPDDGVTIYASTTRLMDTRNGLSQSDPDNFRNLVAGLTEETVPNAWGGYMDAGDWDRRIQHLIVSVYLLDLAEQFGGFFKEVNLNIPESGNDLPDIVDEALFNLDCYRRMQTPAGGIRGGIESEEHPNIGEASWQESLRIMAYAPGSWSSFYYAGVAARAAGVLKKLGRSKLAQVYEDSALAAMRWAENDYAPANRKPRTYTSNGVEIERMDSSFAVRDMRNYAAAELFRLTGDSAWHDIFRRTTKLNQSGVQLNVWQSHDQREAAWVYLNTPRDEVDPKLKQFCREAVLREAQERLRTLSRTGFRWTKHDWAPPTATLSVSDSVNLVRAHALTGEEKYLKTLVLACQTGLGANPLNLCYTTGLGNNSPKNPLHLDSRHTGQAPPEGLTVFGPVDPTSSNDTFLKTVIAPFCYPAPKEWPIMEAYWDVFWYPMMCEFTVQHPMSYNAYAWGYLAVQSSL